MRNSPRKRGSGAVSCSTPVEIFTTQQLIKIPLGELRNLASEKHGIQVKVVDIDWRNKTIRSKTRQVSLP